MKTLIGTDKLYIGGEWVDPASTEKIDVLSASTEEVIGSVPAGTAEDIDRAVAAARAAFPAWSQTPVAERAAYLRAIAKELEARHDEIVEVITQEVGQPVWLAEGQVAGPVRAFNAMADIIESYPFEQKVGTSTVVREPIGVVGAITPWNYPLSLLCNKVASALGSGSTIVAKPSEISPLNAYILAEAVDAAGVPAGVFNLVTGVGPVVGEAISAHPDIDFVSFTGSTRAGRAVQIAAAQTIKKVGLELGGKSANILLEDADLDEALPPSLLNVYRNSGQTCAAHTRLLVPRSKLPEVEELVVKLTPDYPVGDPTAPETKVGPVISEPQWERVQGYIEQGIEEGAKLLVGGPGKPEGLERGYYVKPTVFSNVTPDMTIAREEIFGPVISILPYDSEEEAVQIANDTEYGLSGGVWSADLDRAGQVARRMRTGQVIVNGVPMDPGAPFGGYKQSGNGREFGVFGLEECLEVKAVSA